jgi:hypothetical protein
MPLSKGEAVVRVRVVIEEIVKPKAFDKVSPELDTVTLAVPGVAMSLAEMDAVNRVLLTKVVVRFKLFHLTTELDSKLDPSTVSVKPSPPALAELGLRLVSTGARTATAKVNALVVVPAVG